MEMEKIQKREQFVEKTFPGRMIDLLDRKCVIGNYFNEKVPSDYE
jgi:hypothetical protein